MPELFCLTAKQPPAFTAQCRGGHSVWVNHTHRKSESSALLIQSLCAPAMSWVLRSLATSAQNWTKVSQRHRQQAAQDFRHISFFFFYLLPLLLPFVSLLYPEFRVFLIEVFRRSSNVAVGFSFLLCVTSTRNLVRVTNRDDDRNNFCLVSFKPWEEHRLLHKVTAALF